jgi:hypothetical protein
MFWLSNLLDCLFSSGFGGFLEGLWEFLGGV